ncbi:MAG: hypothetical protein ACK5TN_23830 [Acidobacteriota bacterium]
MLVAERRCRALVAIGGRSLHAVHGIADHGVALAQVVEERGDGRELAADAGRGELVEFEFLAPGDDVAARVTVRSSSGRRKPRKSENSSTSFL